jgi:hypothetical protein
MFGVPALVSFRERVRNNTVVDSDFERPIFFTVFDYSCAGDSRESRQSDGDASGRVGGGSEGGASGTGVDTGGPGIAALSDASGVATLDGWL